jgi:hypothetical protein
VDAGAIHHPAYTTLPTHDPATAGPDTPRVGQSAASATQAASASGRPASTPNGRQPLRAGQRSARRPGRRAGRSRRALRFPPRHLAPRTGHPRSATIACNKDPHQLLPKRTTEFNGVAPATLVAGDEVSGGRQLRRGIRQRGMGYVLAVRFGLGDQVVAEELQLPAA